MPAVRDGLSASEVHEVPKHSGVTATDNAALSIHLRSRCPALRHSP